MCSSEGVKKRPWKKEINESWHLIAFIQRDGTRLDYDMGEWDIGTLCSNPPARICSTALHCLANLVLHHNWLSLFNDEAACP